MTEPYTLLPAEQELRCGLRPLGVGIFGSRPLAVLGLTAANNAALVAEFVVRFAGLVERDHDS
ncbi:MAG: hypothetical protein ABR592_00550 [Nitriliruptorales bacterium]